MMLKYARRVTVFETAAAEISPINPAGAQGFEKTPGADAEDVLHRAGMIIGCTDHMQTPGTEFQE